MPFARSGWIHRVRMIRTGSGLIVAALLCLAGLNIGQRATWRELEDGVLWKAAGGEVVASEVANGTAAARAGLERGDVLLMIDGRIIERVDDVVAMLHASAEGERLRYTVLRMRARQQADIEIAPVPSSPLALYLSLAAVGVFTLLVGASVRLRRPDHQATLHFFWLTVAFFGAMAFSFTGKPDALDWTFYWGDLTAQLMLPPLFLHFALVFPDRPDAWVRSDTGRSLVNAIYLPALLLGGASVTAVVNAAAHGEVLSRVADYVQIAQLLYLAVTLVAGLAIMVRALRMVHSVTARRQLRWIVWGTALGSVPFVFGYALPFAFGLQPMHGFELTALLLGFIPLAFASAIAAIYAVLLRLAGVMFFRDSDERNPIIALLATIVVVLLSRPVKNAIQT